MLGLTTRNYMNSRKSMSVLQYDYLEALASLPPWQIVFRPDGMVGVSQTWTHCQAPHLPLQCHFPWAVCSLGCDIIWPLEVIEGQQRHQLQTSPSL